MTKKYAVSIMSEDKPGIVESVSGCIFNLKGNIISLSQTVVGGYFTIIIIAAFPDNIDKKILSEKLAHSGKVGEYDVIVRNYIDSVLPENLLGSASQYVLTVSGKDLEGLIYYISHNLSQKGINIEDVAAYKEKDSIIIIAQLIVPNSVDLQCLHDELAAIGMSKNLSVHLQHIDIFKETNRI
jgi:glycine cleavage system transcriptional repressor